MDIVDSSANSQLLQDFIGSYSAIFNASVGAGLVKNRLPIMPPLMTSHEISLPRTPPPSTPSTTEEAPEDYTPLYTDVLRMATHVLSTEAAGLKNLSDMYVENPVCRDGFARAVSAIVQSRRENGKVVVVGVGKSGKVGEKLVVTLKSMKVQAEFLNPVEALHGDLGTLNENDVILMISYSGKTAELLQLLPHIPSECPLIAMTAHTSYHTSPLTRGRENSILLPAPIHESETVSFGLAAPTTSTTVAMALGDALALACAYQIHNKPGQGPKEVFKKNHPGGAIGQVNFAEDKRQTGRIRELVVQYEDMLPVASFSHSIGGLLTPALSETSSESDLDLNEWNTTTVDQTEMDAPMVKSLTVLDCLRLAVKSPKGWLRTHDNCVVPPRRLQNFDNVMANALSPEFGVIVDLNDRKQLLFSVEDDTAKVARVLSDRKALGEVTDDTVVAVLDCGKIIGAVEVGTVLEHATC